MTNSQDKTAAAVKGVKYLLAHSSRVTAFEAALALDILHDVLEAAPIIDALLDRLKKQCTPDWLQQAPLADTLLLINVLHEADSHAVTGECLGYVVRRIIAAEERPGGPYKDTDGTRELFLNIQIDRLVHWAAAPLQQLTAFLEQSEHADANYPDWMVHRHVKAPADTATQAANGSWPAIIIRYKPQMASSYVATAKAIAALGKAPRHEEHSMHQTYDLQVFSHIATEIEGLAEPLKEQAQTMLHRIHTANSGYEITLIARFFTESLKQAPQFRLERLGVANVYCWMAYMAYDHIIDDKTHTEYLPLATIAMRRAMYIYRRQVPLFEPFVERIYDEMDTANAWELGAARWTVRGATILVGELPEYGNCHQLARRSFAHVLGPLLIMTRSGYTPGTAAFQKIEQGFLHYLIARQLLDDMKDWPGDIAQGHLSYVVTCLLRDLALTDSAYDVAILQTAMQRMFWQRTASALCEEITAHISRAEEAFQDSDLLTQDNPLYELIHQLRETNNHTIRLHEDGAAFASHFSNPD